jgi:hypothetical protein
VADAYMELKRAHEDIESLREEIARARGTVRAIA